MHPLRVIDLECELYPLNQVHIPTDIIDIVEELGAVRAAPRAIAVRKDPARCTVGVCAVVHHSEQELGDGCNPAAPRADPEVEFFLQTPAGVCRKNSTSGSARGAAGLHPSPSSCSEW